MAAKYVVSIDQGTTGTVVLVLDGKSRVVGQAYSEFTQHYPRPGWVEHDAEEIWKVSLKVLRAALRDAGARAADVAAIGITNQRETVVVWDRKTGKPIHRAIVWQCRRTAEVCAKLKKKGKEKTFRKATGLLLDPYFSGTKLAWILDNVEGARARAEAGELLAGTIDTWLIWKLTAGKVHATDPTNASRTLLYDIRKHKWSKKLCKILGVPRDMLPEVRPSSGDFGTTARGLRIGAIPIAGVAGDQQAALFGQACTRPGLAKNTYGTGCFMLLHTGDKLVHSKNGLLTTVACGPAGEPAYALEGSVFVAGAAVQWLRDELGLIPDAAASEAAARAVPDNGGCYLVPAFVGLGAPYWDPEARGALLGLTRGTNRNHVIRAALEAMAYQTRDLLEAMEKDSGLEMKELRVDGGATANDFMMEFQAAVLGRPVERPEMVQTTALGAAYLAGLGVGFWKAPGELNRVRKVDRRFQAKPDARAAGASAYAGWKAAVERVRS